MKEYANPIMNTLTNLGVHTSAAGKLSEMIMNPKVSLETLVSGINNPNTPLSSEVRETVDKVIKSMEAVEQFRANQLKK